VKQKMQHYNQLIETSNNRNKTSWNIIRNVFHKYIRESYMTSSFKMDDNKSQFKDAVDVFNECFFNIADNLQTPLNKMILPL
jgi:hypothetical protein